jgi:cbb3-type cytochrome oxidase maturation protein
MFWTLMASILAGVLGLVVYIYYMRKGQFDDCEDVKYQLFRNEED